jgi:iron complex outermembrane receptor protein
MKKFTLISIAFSSVLLAGSINLEKVIVEDELDLEVSKEEISFTRQQDLAEILHAYLPEINMVRASAVGNDIVLRGFKRDDINFLIDGAKIYGACPNRMDPPAMHISPTDIESIEVVEGPFDVENFGSMGGVVKVTTKDIKEGFGGEINLIGGSFDYKKGSFYLYGGDEKLKVSISASKESSEQYEDGNGNTLVEQNWLKLGKDDPYAYQEKYKDLKAYKRTTINLKSIYNIDEDQYIKLSLLTDKATDVLYPAFQMDAQLDKTFAVNSKYVLKNRIGKEFSVEGYYSSVVHDMGTEFRNAANNPMMYRTHHVDSYIKGVKVKDEFEAQDILWTIGLDGSDRIWNGICVAEPTKKPKQVRIPDVETKNSALFIKAKKSFDRVSVKFGARYDNSDIDARNLNDPTIKDIAAIQNYFKGKESKSYNNISANVVVNYKLDSDSKVYVALGQGVRVPDAQELYFIGFMMGNWSRKGNPDLKESKNQEIDVGIEKRFDSFGIRVNTFYSKVKDYIYAYKTNEGNKNPNAYYLTWTNIDATIYGGDINIDIPLGDSFLAEISGAYQRGRKDDTIEGQSDKDMAMMPPLRGRVALSYDDGEYFGMIETLLSAGYKDIDSDNGEQEIGGWGVVNLKGSKYINDNMVLNVGVDNLFDKSYTLNNTYVGRALIGGRDPVLINEPGRYIYASLNIKF